MRLEHEAEEAFMVNGSLVFFNPELERYGSVVLLAYWSEKLFIVRSSGRMFAGKLEEKNGRVMVVQLENVLVDFRHCISCAKQYKQHIVVAGPMLEASIIDLSQSGGSSAVIKFPFPTLEIPSACCFTETALVLGCESGKVYMRCGDGLLQLWGDFGNGDSVVFIDCTDGEEHVCCVATSGRVLRGTRQVEFVIPGPVITACMLVNKALLHCTLRGCVYKTDLVVNKSNKLNFKQGRVMSLLKLNDSQAALVFGNGMIHISHQLASEEKSLQELLGELKQCEQDTSLDYAKLEQRILDVNQALALKSSSISAAVLSLERGSPDMLFLLKLAFPLQAANTRFVCRFQQSRWKESITVCKQNGTTHFYFRLPEHGNRQVMLPLDVSVIVVSGTSFAHTLIGRQRFDCLDTGEILSGRDNLARFGAARSTFRVFVLAKNTIWTPTTTRVVELLRSVLNANWTLTEQSPFRANATLLGDTSVRLRLECDGEFVELSGVGRNELSAAVLREALLRRCRAKDWFPREQQCVVETPLAVQREIFEADKMVKLASNDGSAREAIERTLAVWRQIRHVFS